ncbi:Hpt domain-containing protein [Verrucomicrobia bacterium S94]|nr:Hpt domain-containing protein [Verrucomicrobia bacterium S94]
MAQKLGDTTWVNELIPDLEVRKNQFVVDTDEVDDELIEVFVDELHRLSNELKEGLSSENAEMVRIAAHSIKGMGGTIGLPEISVLGLEVENCAKEERLSDARRLVTALGDWMKTLD